MFIFKSFLTKKKQQFMKTLESLGVHFCLTNETEISGHTEFLKRRGRNFEKILPEMSIYFTSLTEFTVFFLAKWKVLFNSQEYQKFNKNPKFHFVKH